MGLSWRNDATLWWLFPWGFMSCHGIALTNEHEFRLIFSCQVIVKISLTCRLSPIVCMGYSWLQALLLFCALNILTFKSVLCEESGDSNKGDRRKKRKTHCDWEKEEARSSFHSLRRFRKHWSYQAAVVGLTFLDVRYSRGRANTFCFPFAGLLLWFLCCWTVRNLQIE